MKATIFYSWQSDHPVTRRLIEKALNAAVKELAKNDSLVVEPRVDRALANVAGAVRIDHDILERIASETCVAFVGDVSLVTAKGEDGRRSPNPNVLVELGFALRGLGWERLILPFNEALGTKAELPFDLEKNRLLVFSAEADSDRAEMVTELSKDFRRALGAILALPGIRERIRGWLEETSPAILKLVRSGRQVVSVNIATHRIGTLIQLKKLRGFEKFVEVRSNGSVVGNETCSNGGINDLAGGMMNGYTFTFNGSPNEW